MPIDTHPKRQGLTPGQVIAEQKRQAAKAGVPATTAPASLPAAVPADNRTPAERLADQISPSFMPGPPVRFNGKEGKFVTPGDDKPLDETTRYVALVPEMWNGFIKFNGEGEQPTRIGGLPYEGYEMPPREELGDTDPNEWPIGLSGKPSDPWLHQILIPIQNVETKEVLCFGTTSTTGRTAVGALLRSYNRMRRTDPTSLPIVQLKPSSYQDRTFGKVNVPSFIICGRTNIDGTKPDTAAADMNDQIPLL